jgi:uncharacterized membrane protein
MKPARSSAPEMRPLPHPHFAFFVSAIAGVAAFAASVLPAPQLSAQIGVNLFFACYLAMTVARLGGLSAAYLERHAANADEPASIIIAVTLVAVVVSFATLFMLLNGDDATNPFELVLALMSVALGWLTIHMMGAMHYAHLYWGREQGEAARRGLDFPGTTDPNGHDFAYFAYVVGMTAQTADIAISSTAMRRVVLMHALVSFLFNAVLVAAAVNVALSFGSA